MENLKQGDKVKHLSGGPKMIVANLSSNVEGEQVLVCCRWYNEWTKGFESVQVYRWELESA